MAGWGTKEPNESEEPQESRDTEDAEDSSQSDDSETSAQSGDTEDSGKSGDSEKSGDAEKSEGSGSLEDQSLPPAPSLGPHTKIEREPPGAGLARHEQSDVDAMGLDKRREVIGGSYGPTKARVVGTFAAFFAVVGIVGVGFYFLAKELDKAPETNADEAPWSAPDAQQRPPKQLQ